VPTVWTIGYERLLPEQLVAELCAAGVGRVIDVRFRAQSRRPGMSKARLGELLGEHGIVYEHRRALGTPPEIRPLYRGGSLTRAAAAFREHMHATGEAELLALAAELDRAPRTALLCLEAEPGHCHRRVLTELLRERRPELRVCDL